MRSCVAWDEAASSTVGSGKVSLEPASAGHRRAKLRRCTGVVPDIQTIGKGLNGGYQALSAVLMSERVIAGLRSGSGCFANGQTFQCHPAAAAAGLAVMSIFESEAIVQNCAKRGAEVSGTTSTTETHFVQSPAIN
jgi:adenosylmethionine-8-amino-7-oxononanoate aminotransferase